jgi:small subunit ribosomal protein S17
MQGEVVSDKGDKTIVVRIDRSYAHPVLKKTIRRSKRYSAHDPDNKHKIGDIVRIQECRPISKRKKWRVLASELDR